MLQSDLPNNVKIAVAVSGGADSVALLHKLVGLSAERGFSLSVVHCEHGIRGEESVEDARFVRALAKSYALPYQEFSEDCLALAERLGVSLEVAARQFRYRCFEEVLAAGAEFVALAHHKDDAVETVLFRLCRGTSLGGVAGMSAVCGRYLRPLLDESKQEILAYVEKHGLKYREDKTNFQRVATRNRLRLDVIPALKEAVSGAADNLLAFAALAKEDDDFLYQLAMPLVERVEPQNNQDSGWRVKLAEPPIFRRACLTVLKELGVEKDYTKKHLQALTELGGLQTGSRVTLPQGIVAVKSYDKLAFWKGAAVESYPQYFFKKGEFPWGRYVLTVSDAPMDAEGALRIDLDKVPEGAVIRTRAEGDCFQRFGGGSKSLKKYLIDQKIPLAVRDGLPILAIGKEVLAIFGVEISEQLKTTSETKNTAYLAVLK